MFFFGCALGVCSLNWSTVDRELGKHVGWSYVDHICVVHSSVFDFSLEYSIEKPLFMTEFLKRRLSFFSY